MKGASKKEPKVAAVRETAERRDSAGSSENPISTIKNFVCNICVERQPAGVSLRDRAADTAATSALQAPGYFAGKQTNN
jgi:hypothetical protein